MAEVASLDADAKLRDWAEANGVWKSQSPAESLLRKSPNQAPEPTASIVATIIAGAGWFSVLVGVLVFGATVLQARSSAVDAGFLIAVAASCVVSGLVTVGFGSIVENVARIERHLRRSR